MSLKDKINAWFQESGAAANESVEGTAIEVGDTAYNAVSQAPDVATQTAHTRAGLFTRILSRKPSSFDIEPVLGQDDESDTLAEVFQGQSPDTGSTDSHGSLNDFLARLRAQNGAQHAYDPAIEQEIIDAVGPRPKPLFLLGALSPRNQYVVGGALAAALLAMGVAVGFVGTREASFDLERVSIATRVQMLSQRLTGAAQLSLQGELNAVNKMRTAQSELVQAMDLLTLGNPETGMRGLSREKFDSLLSLDTSTRTLKEKIGTLINLSTSLVQIESNNAKLEQAATAMFQDADHLHSMAYSSGNASPQQLAAVDHLRLLAERIHRNGILLLRSPNVTNDELAQLIADTNDYRTVLDQLEHGDSRVGMASLAGAKPLFASLDESLAGIDSFVTYMEKHSANIVAARQGQKALAGLSDAILRDATRLTEQLADATASDRNVQGASVLLLFGAMLSMLILAAVNMRLTRIDAWYDNVRKRQAQMEAARAAERNTRNETDMIELMTDISALELRDLTVDYTRDLRAMEGIAGSVRSSVNEGRIALRDAVKTVKVTAGKVSDLVAASTDSTRALEQSNKEQASEIDDVVNEVTNLASNIGRVTEKTLSAARIAEEGKAAAAEGSTVVERGETAMAHIRTLMQEVLKSVKQSGETSQEILELSDAIENITDKTGMIAMNAEMEAARAGTAGAPLKVLAAEVARLAENSMQLQAAIGALAQRNQGETRATIKLVEDSAEAVVEGARLSSRANAELLKIAGLTANIAEIMAEIEITAKSQATNADTVTEKMAALSNLSRQFQVSVTNVVRSVAQIDEAMGSLKQTVDQFRTDPDAE